MSFIKKYLKWLSTFLVLTGILLTNLNIYPINIMFHGAGVVGWTIAGFLIKRQSNTNKLWIANTFIFNRFLSIIILMKNRIFIGEFIGSAFLVMIIVGSGIMAQNLTRDFAVMLLTLSSLGNEFITTFGIFTLPDSPITIFFILKDWTRTNRFFIENYFLAGKHAQGLKTNGSVNGLNQFL